MKKRTMVLVAHNGKKKDMVDWVKFNKGTLEKFEIYCTKATGERIIKDVGLPVNLLLSGPLGGDSQVGAMIAEKRADLIIFFWDPLSIHPHDVDIKAVLRLAVLHDIPIACNHSTADFLISSPLLKEEKS
ncbi:methylglyoxal synthase [bacterium]|nr:methylglyoxal synthase [bacterium]NIN92113.1 methylglyoxal synthase [bacterium]NIO18319.1 methylglyoxal synthase [bacterium]NIO73284.1 methylglyoxal synthase [bacterium]